MSRSAASWNTDICVQCSPWPSANLYWSVMSWRVTSPDDLVRTRRPTWVRFTLTGSMVPSFLREWNTTSLLICRRKEIGTVKTNTVCLLSSNCLVIGHKTQQPASDVIKYKHILSNSRKRVIQRHSPRQTRTQHQMGSKSVRAWWPGLTQVHICTCLYGLQMKNQKISVTQSTENICLSFYIALT